MRLCSRSVRGSDSDSGSGSVVVSGAGAGCGVGDGSVFLKLLGGRKQRTMRKIKLTRGISIIEIQSQLRPVS